jgi:hypothetical protein
MTAISVSSFAGAPALNAWETAQIWSTRRTAMIEQFADAADVLRFGFSDAGTNDITGKSALAIQAGIDRVNAAAKAKASAAALEFTPPQAPVFPTIYYAGSTIIDLAKNTLTFDDGTVLDIATGVNVDLVV